MTVAIVYSRALAGVNAPLVTVEVHLRAVLRHSPWSAYPRRRYAKAVIASSELSLTGALRPVHGALAMTLKEHRDGRAFILPRASAAEAALVREAVVHPAETLLSVCGHVTGKEPLPPQVASRDEAIEVTHPDLAGVKGRLHARRALEIAATGRHSLLNAGAAYVDALLRDWIATAQSANDRFEHGKATTTGGRKRTRRSLQ